MSIKEEIETLLRKAIGVGKVGIIFDFEENEMDAVFDFIKNELDRGKFEYYFPNKQDPDYVYIFLPGHKPYDPL